jgi:hypothetical protein
VTEAEWLAATDPYGMLEFLYGRSSERKLRLFAVAGVRRLWSLLTDLGSREAAEAAVCYADGTIGQRELERAAARALNPVGTTADQFARHVVLVSLCRALLEAAHRVHPDAGVSILRDLFGNPFRPTPVVDPAWLAWQGGTVRELAQVAYEERRLPEGTLDPGRLAVLADALEDAGCADADLLGHLRGPGHHVRGCWAVDLLLGKR